MIYKLLRLLQIKISIFIKLTISVVDFSAPFSLDLEYSFAFVNVIFVLKDQRFDWTGTGTVLFIDEDEITRLVHKDVPDFSIYCRLSIYRWIRKH